MADKYIKNIDFAQVLPLAEQVGYQPGQIVSKTLAQNGALSLTLFAFDKGEEISTHESEGDAMVVALDGEGEITVGGEKFTVHAGKRLLCPARRRMPFTRRSALKCF
jgi:quercetin dioxygenase-like cupin family protein